MIELYNCTQLHFMKIFIINYNKILVIDLEIFKVYHYDYRLGIQSKLDFSNTHVNRLEKDV